MKANEFDYGGCLMHGARRDQFDRSSRQFLLRDCLIFFFLPFSLRVVFVDGNSCIQRLLGMRGQ
jgi:hypothetical protein